jgi:hypothetical protein
MRYSPPLLTNIERSKASRIPISRTRMSSVPSKPTTSSPAVSRVIARQFEGVILAVFQPCGQCHAINNCASCSANPKKRCGSRRNSNAVAVTTWLVARAKLKPAGRQALCAQLHARCKTIRDLRAQLNLRLRSVGPSIYSTKPTNRQRLHGYEIAVKSYQLCMSRSELSWAFFGNTPCHGRGNIFVQLD